jgi:hypothetical protein
MNPAFAVAPLRLSLSASRGAPRHVLSLPYPPPQKLVREGGGVVKVLGPGSQGFTKGLLLGRGCPVSLA